MSGIKLLSAKVFTPAKGVINIAAKQISRRQHFDKDFFVNFEKQEKTSPKDLFKLIWGEPKYFVFKRTAEKYKLVKDSKIKKHLNEKLNGQGGFDNIKYCEDLSDAYNVLQGSYSMLGDVDEYYKMYKKVEGQENAESLIDVSMNKLNFLYNITNHLKKYGATLLLNQNKKIINFKNEQRLEALKKYVADYSKEEPDMTNYMYQKYYLPRLSKNIKVQCEKIDKEFGTKVFVYDEREQPNLDFIYDELLDWKTKGKGEAKFPNIIDLSKIKEGYISIEKPSAGFYNPNNRSISLKSLNATRHEMIHRNTKDGILQQAYFHPIMVKRKYETELVKADLTPNQIDLAYKDKDEFIAWAGENGYSKYSNEFKAELANLGLPKWVFDLKPMRPVVEE